MKREKLVRSVGLGMFVGLCGVLFLGSFSSPATGANHAEWGYSGAIGPEHWGNLEGRNIACKLGRTQSPVDITAATEANLSPLRFHYGDSKLSVVNNGHTVQVNYNEGSYLQVDGQRFDLKQFHFHSPSENTINGKSYPLEAHLVHADKDGNLAVVGVLFDSGAKSELLDPVWVSMPEKKNGKNGSDQTINAADFLRSNGGYYRFSGSLTTPPCSEGVRWFVMKDALTVSEAQIAKFRKAIGGHHNNRPVQPLFARLVLE